jgi:spermidine synthase
LAALTPHSGIPSLLEERAPDWRASWPVYTAIGLSGLSALGAEVIWTRLLSLMLGATVYTFSLILAVFLAGLAMGSSVGSLMARVVARPRLALGVCQMLLGGAVAWAAYALAFTIPFLPVTLQLTPGPWYTFQLDLMRCLWVVLPAACLWGASFPLALAAAASPGQDAGRLVARVYAANTVGAIIGAAGFSVVLIPWAGTQQSQRLLIAVCAASSLIVLVRRPLRAGLGLALTACAATLAVLAANLGPIRWEAVGYGRHLLNMRGFAQPLFVGEGMNASVAVSKLADGARQFHISGRVEASADLQDMRMQRMLGHLPALLHAGPRSALIVGCGAGVTAGAFVVHPEVRQIVVCELEPLVPKVVARYFARENHDVLRDPRTQVVFDDARHFIFTTRQKFDVITSDPIHPWIKGAAALYTREYFELCKRSLNPGGVVAQWVPLYESSLATVRSEIATFFEVFPNGTIWSNNMNGPGYDLVLLGAAGTPRIDVDALEARLARPDHARVAESLRDVRFNSAIGLLATYAGQAGDLRAWLRGAAINRDSNLRLQYLAGMSVNENGAEFIYEDMLLHRRFPDSLFMVAGARQQALRKALGF